MLYMLHLCRGVDVVYALMCTYLHNNNIILKYYLIFRFRLHALRRRDGAGAYALVIGHIEILRSAANVIDEKIYKQSIHTHRGY